MSRESAWPAAETALDIHARLCQDDAVAPSELALHFLDPLAIWLHRKNPSVDPHLCDEAAEDAIITLIMNPRKYDPARSPLDSYLRMSAQGDLRNALEKERRHSKRRAPLEAVEHSGATGNYVQEGSDPERIVAREDEDRRALERALSQEIVWTFTPGERTFLELMLQEERRTAVYAAVLGITHLSEIEQRREVKRVKDRIKKRLERARGKT